MCLYLCVFMRGNPSGSYQEKQMNGCCVRILGRSVGMKKSDNSVLRATEMRRPQYQCLHNHCDVVSVCVSWSGFALLVCNDCND